MQTKTISGIIHIKDGVCYKNSDCSGSSFDPYELARELNNSGLDRIIVFEHSSNDEEHDTNILAIKEMTRNLEIALCAGGSVNRLEDIKKFTYAGAREVIVDGSHPDAVELCREGSARFGDEKIIVTLKNMDFIFKVKHETESIRGAYIVMDEAIYSAVEDESKVPYFLYTDEKEASKVSSLLFSNKAAGIVNEAFVSNDFDAMLLKNDVSKLGIPMGNFNPQVSWAELKKNEQDMVPVVVQDYLTDEVLMVAYMNEEAFNATLRCGRMTYYSRSRQKLWLKGETSGHFQFVKALYADCDKDTILAKVSQIGAACHTGSRSCFFNEIVKTNFIEKNPQKVLEEVYETVMDRKEHPKEGSYTNYLFDKGIDKILKKVGEEATEIVIAAKNPNPEEIKYEISDFLYHVIVLMAEKGVTWEDIAGELAQR